MSWSASPVSGSGIATTVAGSLSTPTTITPTAVGTYTYTVSGNDATLGCNTSASTVSVSVINPLAGVTTAATATPSTVCAGTPSSLSVSVTKSGNSTASGAGTSTSSTSGYPTAFGNYNYQDWQQFLFKGSELTSYGLTAGNITAIKFNISALPDGYATFYTVRIGTTASTALSSFTTTGLSTVYGPVTLSGLVVGLNTLTFSTPFNWDGSSNIIIDLRYTGNDAFANATTYYTTTSFNSVLYATSGSTNNTSYYTSSPTPTTSTSRPNVIFVGNTAPTPTAYTWNDGTSTVGTTNPLTVSPTVNTTYTVTATVSGCPATATTSVSVSPVPSAPTLVSNSTQCGPGIPTCSVSGGTAGQYRWYTVLSGGTAIGGETGASLTATTVSTTTNYYVAINNGTCESTRILVTATVTTPPAISVTASSNPLCVGQSTTLSVSSTNDPNYTYTWNNSLGTGNSKSVFPTSTTTYSVTATDASVTGTYNTCVTNGSVAITVNALPIIGTTTASPSIVCSGGNVSLSTIGVSTATSNVAIGTFSIASNAAATPYRNSVSTTARMQYLYTAAELSAAGMVAGNINSLSFNVTSVGSGTMTNYTISLASLAGTTALTTSFTNSGLTTVYGPVSYTPTLGTNTHSFSTPYYWDGTSSLLVNICHTGSGGTQAAVDCSQPTNMVLTTSGTSVCAATTGTIQTRRPVITFNAYTNVTGAYTWAWNPGGLSGATQTVNPTTNTTYTVTATNTNNCTASTSVAVTVTPVAVTGITVPATICAGTSFTLAANTSGAAATAYAWSDGVGGTYAGTQSITATLSGGTYTFSVTTTDACGGTSTISQTVTVNSVPILSPSSNTPVCTGQTLNLSGNMTGTATSYSWSGPNGFTSTSQNPTITGVTTAAAGTYTFNASNNGCPATAATTAVVVNTSPSAITVTPATATICNGASQALVASGGVVSNTMTSGTQQNQNTNGALSSTDYPASYSIGYGGQRMQILVLASELSAAGFVSGSRLNSIQFPVVSLGSNWGSTITSCNNFQVKAGFTNITSISTFQTGLTQVVAPANFTPVVGYNNTHTFATPLTWNGTDNLVIETTFSNNITGLTSDGVTQYNTNTAFQSTIVYRVDGNTAAAVAAATAATYAYNARPDFKLNGSAIGTYNWTPTSNISPTTGANVTVTPTATTTYTVNTTINGCAAPSGSSAITVNTLPTAGITNNTGTTTLTCATTSISVTATGGTTYAWSGGLGSSANATITSAGNYTVTVTNSNGCTSTAGITVTQDITTPTAGITNNTGTTLLTCTTTSISVTATGGASYAWSGGLGSAATASITAPASYTVTVTGSNGCTSTAGITATQNITTPTAGITNNTGTTVLTCNTTSISVTATGGTSYAWSGGLGNTANAVITSAGTYTVTVSISNGCTSTAAITVTPNNTAPTVAITGTAIGCGSVSLTATGGTSYNWSGGATPTTAANSFTTTGTYTVTATTANGCTSSVSQLVTVNAIQTATITPSGATTFCAGNSVDLTASNTTNNALSITNSSSYVIDNSMTIPTPSAGFTVEGWIYLNNYSGNNGFAARTLNNIPAPFDVYTQSGTGVLSFRTGNGTSFNSVNSLSPIPLNTWTHIACVYDPSSSTSTIYINGTPTIIATGVTTTPTNAGTSFRIGSRSDGNTQLNGSVDEVRIWNSVRTTAQIQASMSTTIPANSTSLVGYYRFDEGTGSTAINAVTGAASGTLVNSPSWMTPSTSPVVGSATYSWTPGGATTQVLTATTSGTYNVTVTFDNGCTSSASQSVTVNPVPTAGITGTATACTTVNLTATGGTSYAWSGGATPTTAANSFATSGTYNVTVSNALGCTATTSSAVVVNSVPTSLVITATPTTLCAGSSVSLNATCNSNATGGVSTTTLLSEGFNGGTNNWTTVNNSIGGLPSAAAWTLQTDGYFYANSSETFTSNDSTQFYMTNNDAQGGSATLTSTELISPVVNTTGYTALNLSFYHYFDYVGANDTAFVDVSTDGTSWTTVQTYTSSVVGSSQGFNHENINLNTYAGNAAVYVRFRYTSDLGGWYWALDNVSITGTNNNAPATYSWSSTPAGFTSSTQSPTVTSLSASTTAFNVTATNSSGCTATTTLPVTVLTSPTASISGTPSACTSVSLTAAGGTSYAWSGGAATTSATNTFTTSGTYTVTATAANTCTATASQAVSISTASVAATATTASPDHGCMPTVTLTATGATLGTNATLNWYTGAGGTGTNVGSGSPLTITPPTGITTYYAYIAGDCNAVETNVVVPVGGSVNVELAPTSVSTATIICQDGTWSYYENPSDPGRYLFAINWDPNGDGLGANSTAAKAAAVVSLGVNNNYYSVTSTSNGGPQGTWAMSRYWNINDGGLPLDAEGVNIRFYYDPAEKAAIETAAQNWAQANGSTYEGFLWFKTVGVAYDPTTQLNYLGVAPGSTIALTPTAISTENGVTYAQFNNITSFSGGTGSAGVGAGNPLPLTLLTFNGVNEGKTNHLYWSTATEQNLSHFDVMRSKDGMHFSKIGEVAATGNTTTRHDYQFIDVHPYTGYNYYQLVPTDNDGVTHPTNIIVLNVHADKPTLVNLYPNPSRDIVNMDMYSPDNETVDCKLVDNMGRVVRSFTMNLVAGNNSQTLDVAALSSGVYYVQFTCCGGEVFVQKIVRDRE